MDPKSQRATETLQPVVVLREPPTSQDKSADSINASWWERYKRAIADLPEDTRWILEEDARYIADCAMPTKDGVVDVDSFLPHRVRTGIVVGSVQSGKTASMLAVTAILLDKGVDLIVILAGTRVALWLQTYERLLRQLDQTDLYTAWERNGQRVIIPHPEDILGNEARVDPIRYLRGARLKVKNALEKGRPAIFVVPKEDDHLLALSRFLVDQTSDVEKYSNNKIRLVVLDDEADDASILDSREGSKITPQFIQYLWSSSKDAPGTRHEGLLASYIAYTATPQANYLQRSHNPLAPRHFHAALRVPADRGERYPRHVTYHEQKGLANYYIGGEIFYERLRGLPGDPCVSYAFPLPHIGEDSTETIARYRTVRWQMIGDALRSYFVAGAMRLLSQKKQLTTLPTTPLELEKVRQLLPYAHSMLVHPSALKDEHFSTAQDIVQWSKGRTEIEAGEGFRFAEFGDVPLQLDHVHLAERLVSEEAAWKFWATSFSDAGVALSAIPGGGVNSIIPPSWDEVKATLVAEVFPNVRLRVLNSDPRADDRPGFSPTRSEPEPHLWNVPRDIYSIFVAGNVLSRGLTVEGLCTSLFLRSASEPAADTQMQMQRWFGYRGRHLQFCKVFLFADQLQLFRNYHQTDIALKSEVLKHMDVLTAPFMDGVLVLQGDSFKATSKVDSRRVPLHPGPTPSIRLVEPSDGPLYDANIKVVQDLLEMGSWNTLAYPVEIERGLIRSETLSLVEVASVLERLRYSSHDPDLSLDTSRRWVSLQRMLGIIDPLFRPPAEMPGAAAVDPQGCPYSIAAYLRLWSIALRRNDLPGLQPTDNPIMPWHMLDLSLYRANEPRFHVGIRFGSETQTLRVQYQGKSIPMMRRGRAGSRKDLLATLWGSRNPTDRWLGDQAFDYHWHGVSNSPRILEDGAWRARGAPGLLLLHLVVEPNTGRELIAFGLALPHGGPDHVAALRIESDSSQ